jgi:rubredoxin-NAD+ reductase
MAKYVCNVCGWTYDEQLGDEDNGLQAGVSFADLPEDFACPLCGVGKEDFTEE